MPRFILKASSCQILISEENAFQYQKFQAFFFTTMLEKMGNPLTIIIRSAHNEKKKMVTCGFHYSNFKSAEKRINKALRARRY